MKCLRKSVHHEKKENVHYDLFVAQTLPSIAARIYSCTNLASFLNLRKIVPAKISTFTVTTTLCLSRKRKGLNAPSADKRTFKYLLNGDNFVRL